MKKNKLKDLEEVSHSRPHLEQPAVPSLTDAEVERVIQAIKKVWK